VSTETVYSPNPIFAALLQEMPDSHPVRLQYGLGHREELVVVLEPDAVHDPPVQVPILMPGRRMTAVGR
jgi:hypothetical protein